jgi:hypothetical protein
VTSGTHAYVSNLNIRATNTPSRREGFRLKLIHGANQPAGAIGVSFWIWSHSEMTREICMQLNDDNMQIAHS